MEAPSYTKTFHHDTYPAIDPTRPELSVAGKVVVVSGGGQGIGAAIVKAFAQAGAAHIAIFGRKESTLNAVKSEVEASHKASVHVYQADVTDEAAVNHVFADIERKAGKVNVFAHHVLEVSLIRAKVNIFVHNAGYLANPAPIASSSVADLWKPFEVNIKGTLIGALAFLKAAASDAVFVYVNSAAAIFRYFGPMATYAASKGGATKIIESLSVENPGIRWYNLQPGIVQTEMGSKAGVKVDEVDTPELPAHFTVWLASPEGKLVNGRFLYANWDVEELKQHPEDFEDPDFLSLTLKGFHQLKHTHKITFK